MRSLTALSLPLLASVLAAAPAGHGAPADLRATLPGVRVAQDLRSVVERSTSLAEARAATATLPGILGATYTEHGGEDAPRWRIKFQRTIPVRQFCEGMGWSRPYAVAPGVHQATWEIDLWRADFLDFYRWPGIRSTKPHVGRWAVRALLTGRPQGELPEVSTISSPAYDLLMYDGEVYGIEMLPWKPEYDDLWLLEEVRKEHQRSPLIDAVAQPASYAGPCPVEIKFTGTLHGFRMKKADVRWERSDGVWTGIESVEIRSGRQAVRTSWRVGAPGQKLELWQKLRMNPLNLTSEPAKVTIRCQ